MKKYSFLGLLAVLALVGCGTKMGSIDTTVSVRLAIETGDTSRDTIYTANWDAFYFYGDTLSYHSPTLEDVLAKRLRVKEFAGSTVPPKSTPDGMGEVVDTTRVRFDHLTQQRAILVIYDPNTEAFAWRPIELVDGLPEVALSFYIRPWKLTTYTENKWIIVLKPAPPEPEEPENPEDPEDPEEPEEPENPESEE